MQRCITRVVCAVATAAVLLIPSGLAAAKGPGGGGEETLGNNLSVPAVFVPGTSGAPALRLGCPATPIDPSGPKSSTFPDYWLQKTEATWSAACGTASDASVVVDWGDNLTRAVSLKAGAPVRVEVSLLMTTGMTGYVITNLTPDLADRLATYGTDGTVLPATTPTRVWDAGATLRIVNAGGAIIFNGHMSAEINSTGGVVFGYNWGIKGRNNTPALGTYTLTFSVPDRTTFTGIADAGTANPPSFGAHSTTLTIQIVGSNPGGGPKH